jgi:cold shock CspA family protein
MEANHRHLMAEFADWLENVRKPKAPLPQNFQHTVTPSTRYDLKTPLQTWTTSTTKSPRFHRDIASHHTQHTSRPKQHQQPNTTAMPTDNLANAFQLGPEIPIRPRNPHTRGTPKHLKRQNINRNVRLHLRNDRKNVQEDFNKNKKVTNNSKRLRGEATRWNPTRGFGFIRPTDGGEDVFCHFSSITDGSVLCEGDMVEYQAEYDDSKGKYMAIKVTGGRKEGVRRGAEQIAIDLNKQILSSDTESLYTIIKTRAADFNHVKRGNSPAQSA